MATHVVRHADRHLEKFFFPGMAVLILVTVFLGFARSYYLAGVFKAVPLPPLLLNHGAVLSSWVLLLIVQTSLVATGRVDLHRRLGLLGFCLACLVVILGLLVATNAMVRYFDAAEALHRQAELRANYAFQTFDMLIFSTLIYFAFRYRSNPAAHKRLVIIATIALLDAAFGRWPIDVVSKHFQLGCFALLLILIGHDLWSTRKIHRATLWAGAFFFMLYPVRGPIGHTVPWQAFATWVQNLARSSHFFDSHFFH
jgi:uncharacterized membrane protein YidH (DUF202 family)